MVGGGPLQALELTPQGEEVVWMGDPVQGLELAGRLQVLQVLGASPERTTQLVSQLASST
jgi:hypothetical protein